MPTPNHPTLLHHGGTSGVTGSCHQLVADEAHSLLVDCGLFQGEDAAADAFRQLSVDFDITTVQALVVTHVHIDHIGRLPYLLAAGYRGPILCSPPSARLLPLVIEDALKVGFTRDADLIQRFLEQVEGQLQPLPYGQWHTVADTPDLSLRVRLERAGHILGSAYVKVAWQDKRRGREQRIVFSGDLGAPHTPLLPAPRSPHHADWLILESTYGDRLHGNRTNRQQALGKAIARALENDGTVIIPAFSIGRTQELLYELEDLIHAGGSPWADLEIIVDSPLAARFTQVYRQLKPWWNAEAKKRLQAGRRPLGFENLYTVDSHEEHLQTVAYLARTGRPAVVLAASGMAAGGRVVNYLKAMLGSEQHQVLFVGYQAAGTPGRDIQQYGPRGGWVMLDGERYTIRAGVSTVSGYSGHADQRDLVGFVRRMKRWPSRIRLVHGEPAARQALGDALRGLYAGRGLEVVIEGMGKGHWARDRHSRLV
ncbi:MBL fold metallo-hydrolase [Ectothiorhodospira haloalkaliphila]|uniref:MBL fold metallo-hydrolase RNA specificity domain-containing protein n=1 Tax=Ectothiorhodospira haloalkaliphila TaxID=421628 RepID=UPI001EE93027|nr:MBL fold metallo-hydrolase [Ectothiorhodospira haloalkaliphila]MCG5523597.1 MBL fold metallo-hydrolase [Ectothiorhodospira haloalkaliphila]